MRTRKHQSPAESSWVEKLKCEDGAKLVGETQTTPNPKKNEETNGSQSEPLENSVTSDEKKVNGKKQKKRRRSPRNKDSPLKAEAALLGMMTDSVWLDKYVYDDAECYYHARLATEQNLLPSAKATAIKKHKNSAMGGCCHASTVACHHVSKGIWVNKFNFEDAESHFVMRFSSPLAPRVLNLNLLSPDCTAPKTPDEGYASATPTPAAVHNSLTVNAIASDRTVNGKPHWAGLQSLLTEVWLDKSLYDQAEARYYEHVAQAKPNPNAWSHHTGKRAKKDKWSRKSAGKQRKELASIPEEATTNALYYPTYYLHTDSERVWLDKVAYDQAEEDFHSTRSHRTTDAMKFYKLPSVAKRPRAVKSRHIGKKDMAASFLSTDKIWFDKYKYDDAEKQYYEQLTQKSGPDCQNQTQEDGASTILKDIARARENIQKSLAGLRTVLHSPKEGQAPPPPSQTGSHTSAATPNSGESCELLSRVASLEHENQNLHKVVRDLQSAISKLESRISTLEKSATSTASAPLPPPVCKLSAPRPAPACPPAAAPQPKAEEDDDDDDDIDLFGSDEEEEDAEAARIREERLQQYAEKKSKKPGLIAKSSILLDVKPWDDETDMAKLEECVRTVHMDGLLWGSSKLVPVGYGIKKLQIQCVVEDDKVGTDMLEEEITKFEDYVQSVDIAAFNKI